MANTPLEELGNNLAALVGALVANPIMMVAAGRRFTEGVFGIPPQSRGPVHVEHTCHGIVRHHYSCCCVPPCYGCGGGCR